jgi:hypothetical protein
VTNPWNRCDICGRFIPFDDFKNGLAINEMITPDSDISSESWQTLCREHIAAKSDRYTGTGIGNI